MVLDPNAEPVAASPLPSGTPEPVASNGAYSENGHSQVIADLPDLVPVSAAAPAATVPVEPVRRQRRIPHFGHMALFLLITGVTVMITEIAAFAVAIGLHLFGRETTEQLVREPRLLVPSMAVSYIIAGTIIWAVFRTMWHRPFSWGIHWNAAVVSRRVWVFPVIGVVLSMLVQFLSKYLPIPKTLPINDFFRTPVDVWLVAIFGTTLAPSFEELTFRGFLLPSLATAFDWIGGRRKSRALDNAPSQDIVSQEATLHGPAVRDPKWSMPAVVLSSIITSIGFALLHSDQLAHAWAPLAVLFTVSLVLCAVRLRTQSLAASTLVHATYNFTIFAALCIATGGFRHLDKITK